MKRTLSMLLVLAMLLSCLPFTAQAVSEPKYTSLQLNINWEHIKTVGKQDFNGQACACYALAYCRTMLDDKVHEWHEFSNTKDENKASAQWGNAKYTSYKTKDKAAAFRKLYEELCNGNPTVAQVKTVGKSNIHYVTVVGFTGVTDLDTLSEENFLILDPGRNPHKIFNMSDKRELRKNPDDSNYRIYRDTSSATVKFTSEPYVSEPVVTEPIVTEPIVTEPIVTEPIVTEPPVIDDGKWPAPTDLRWGYTVEYGVDENGTFNGEINVVPGRPTDITFKAHADASYANVTLYREAGDNDVRINSRYVSCYDGYAYDSYLAGTPELETGDYYFTVSIYGRGDYADSEIATSDVWHYTKPSAQLAAPTDLTWNGTKISCTLKGDTSHLGGYSVAWYYGATADVEPTGAGSLQSVNLDTAPLNEVDLQNDPSFLMSKNIGYYYYKLELYSDDVTVIRNSEETGYSEALYFDGTNFEIRPGYTPDVPPAVEDGRIGTPYDLQWGYGVAFNNQGGSRYPSASFHASWKIDPLNHGEEYEISVYKENGDNDILMGSYSSNYSYSTVYKYAESRYAGTLDLETGDYYFTVMSYKRKDNWIDRDVSDVAVSPVWHYTKPNSKIGKCTNLTWNWPEDNLFTSSNLDGDTPTANWKYPDDPNVDGYQVQWYYSKTNGGELRYLYDSWVHWKGEDATFGSIYEHNGAGYYYFKVRALSEDTSKICNGDYVLSSPCYFDGEKGSTELPSEPHTHEYGDWTVTTEATCTTEGSRTRVCACGETETESISATGHTYGDWAESKAATCTETGEDRRDCANCDHFETQEINAKGHTEVIDVKVDATCTEPGKTEGKHCETCGEVLVAQEEIPATDHKWDNGKVTKEPTETLEGEKNYTCTVCSETKTEPIAKLEHTHTYNSVVTAPTCTEQGYTTYTCSCGHSYVDDYTNAKGHAEAIDAKVDATCTEKGKTEGKHCETCGEVLVAQEEIPATDHKWDNGKVTKEPTATEDGVKTYTCTNCGEIKTEVIPATGEEIVWGDASGDDRVNAMDATRILRYAAKLIKEDKIDLVAADVNSDGRVNAMDATRILRYAAKLIPELKVQK